MVGKGVSLMSDTIVAGPLVAKYSARCKRCQLRIQQGRDRVVKVADKGPTTTHGQGPGYWIHDACRLDKIETARPSP